MTWQNWAGTATADPARWYWPRTTEAIADAVRDAAAAGSRCAPSAAGTRRSPPPLSTSGAAIDLSGWTGIASVSLEDALRCRGWPHHGAVGYHDQGAERGRSTRSAWP